VLSTGSTIFNQYFLTNKINSMDTSNYPTNTPESTSPGKDFRNLIIGLLTIGLIGSAGYALYSNNEHQNVQQTDQSQITKITDDKGQVQKNFDNALVRLDSLTGYNNKVQGMLAGRQNDISKLKLQIRGILHKEKLTETEKKKAEELVAQLNDKISNMEQAVATLTQQNEGLTQDKAQLTQDKDKLTADLQTTSTEKDELAKKVDIASTLNASNIMITAVQDKKNGQEKITDNAKRVNKLKISFDVANRIAAGGQTDVYVCITGPDNKIISVADMGSGTFTSRDDGDKMFTSKVPVEIEAGKVKPVQFSWKQDNGFQTGQYKIEIYHNGYKIGEAIKDLKKGGLFS
jgi:peptidoglycan hydrolase CwlO-like protein